MRIESKNPATNRTIEVFTEYSEEQVDGLIQQTHETFLEWKNTTFSERSKLMLKVAATLRKNKEEYARIMTIEMGKPITQAIAEVEKCAWVCQYYAENTESILQNEIIQTDASESYVEFDPIGIVLAVMPWNFPFWQVFRFAAPALMAGNVALLKHASNVPLSALAIEEIFQLAGFPQNAFTTLLISSREVQRVIENPLVQASTITGSEPAGSKVAEISGKNIKTSVLELGGSDPFIILEDADIEKAAKIGVFARIINNGQSCIAAKRFIYVEKIAEQFEKLFTENMSKLKIGNPLDIETELGPIAREDLLLELDIQVQTSIKQGATLLLGGYRIEGIGAFYQPTILSNVKKGMLAYSDELFGPVAILIKVKDEEEAIQVANDSEFGLGASLWTSDLEKAKLIAKRIESGSVFINGMVKSDPRLPFGGIKKSGFGRELSHYGIKEFVNIKTIWIAI